MATPTSSNMSLPASFPILPSFLLGARIASVLLFVDERLPGVCEDASGTTSLSLLFLFL